ncbi:MAG TPA: tRNA uridine-5-carboxymethylaminomethyl(34) synthesis GTPase MnmE [Thermoanaerobaculia bacterium]|nr:tRNA uridine-5-carboxymethylaminomethyl(34) synthesis GTPase MnmE [Thermoanaerobaculia bacterium]
MNEPVSEATSSLFDTIVAPATSPVRSALAIVRLDGPESLHIVNKLTESDVPPERRAVLRAIRHRGELIDEAMVTCYHAPRSFTGNDMAEFTLHGNPLLVDLVIRAAVESGARIAEPGEFTERAVLNGKLDLVQAESVHDLIASRTKLQARLSLDNLEGSLSSEARTLRERLLFVISRLEAALDFAEEGYEFITAAEVAETLGTTLDIIRSIRSTYERGRATREGLLAVILGQPNAGKSSLMNMLCGSERAIVTELPGTTRDLLRETIEVGGLPVTITDTAGLRESQDAVETMGVERARRAAAAADIVIYLVDSTRGMDEVDRNELRGHEGALLVFTKMDLAPAQEGSLGISVTTGLGVDRFLKLLDREVADRFAPAEGSPTIVNERQREAIGECEAALESASDAARQGMNEEILTAELYRAANALGALTGAITRQDVLHEIFAKFCIGK